MKRVHYFCNGPRVQLSVVKSHDVELRLNGKLWGGTNWNGTRETLARLQAQNPDVEFVEILVPSNYDKT